MGAHPSAPGTGARLGRHSPSGSPRTSGLPMPSAAHTARSSRGLLQRGRGEPAVGARGPAPLLRGPVWCGRPLTWVSFPATGPHSPCPSRPPPPASGAAPTARSEFPPGTAFVSMWAPVLARQLGCAAPKGAGGVPGFLPGVTSLFCAALAPKPCQGFVLRGCAGEKKLNEAVTRVCVPASLVPGAGPVSGQWVRGQGRQAAPDAAPPPRGHSQHPRPQRARPRASQPEPPAGRASGRSGREGPGGAPLAPGGWPSGGAVPSRRTAGVHATPAKRSP